MTIRVIIRVALLYRMNTNVKCIDIVNRIIINQIVRTLFLFFIFTFYFLQPFDTRDLNIYNKKDCKVLYGQVKESVEDGLQTLLRFRESDPYREFVPRAIYEFASGGKQAPTAPLNLK